MFSNSKMFLHNLYKHIIFGMKSMLNLIGSTIGWWFWKTISAWDNIPKYDNYILGFFIFLQTTNNLFWWGAPFNSYIFYCRLETASYYIKDVPSIFQDKIKVHPASGRIYLLPAIYRVNPGMRIDTNILTNIQTNRKADI